MWKPFKLTYFIAIGLAFILWSCNATKHVPKGKYLVHKNDIVLRGDKLDMEGIHGIIRQQANKKSFGVKLRLYVYNSIDSAKVVASRQKHFAKLRKKNNKKLARQKRINDRRIAKARAKGKDSYIEKTIPLKDSLNPRLSIREWLKYKKGEPPVIFDSVLHQKSVDQLKVYMKKKGYYFATVCSDFSESRTNPQKRTITYEIFTGQPFVIKNLDIVCDNPDVRAAYQSYQKDHKYHQLVGEKLDSDYLNDHRFKTAKYMKDKKLYGFSPSSITFKADTSGNSFDVGLKIRFADRKIPGNDTIYTVPYQPTGVRKVHFHLIDTTYIKGSYAQKVEEHQLNGESSQYLFTFDTLHYRKIYYTKSDKKKRKISLDKDTLNPWRFATVMYNGKPAVKPEILELQNYLESNNTYKEYYIDRSYNRLLQLDVFEVIKPVIKEVEGEPLIDVHYYLVPAKKQSFNVEPRFTNSNGFLGLAASLNYNNKNLFRGSEKLTISFSGGFESQPPVFDKSVDGSKIKRAGRSFNTFEVGPSIKLDLPGLFPARATALSKRHRPRTVLSAAYNFQSRADFVRSIFQLNYLWKFYTGKKQVFQVGFPAAAVKFVSIKKSTAFEQTLDQTNDLFLKNAYSDQFVWEDFKFMYEYNNKADKKGKANVLFNASFTEAGGLLSQFNIKDTTETGQSKVFGVGFSRFVRFDTDFIYGYPINKKSSIHFRSALGLGVPNGNKTPSLPFDYSFFAGGSNDNRGWRARGLGPGAYKYYLDLNRTATQLGDIRVGWFAEWRYSLSDIIKTAIFVDAGNIWTYKKDDNRIGSQFSKNFMKEIALSSGVGLRLDMSFFVIRLDLGIPLTNPALPDGAKWIFQSRQPYYDEGLDKLGADYKKLLPNPFIPILAFGIGYPF
ncbi:MAG: hypothetical protein EP338_08435 [Bacteroidetes bacterium]|nr:MAG: hypothetical protein EP338_08435 [Bacteroidota bacterium]